MLFKVDIYFLLIRVVFSISGNKCLSPKRRNQFTFPKKNDQGDSLGVELTIPHKASSQGTKVLTSLDKAEPENNVP